MGADPPLRGRKSAANPEEPSRGAGRGRIPRLPGLRAALRRSGSDADARVDGDATVRTDEDRVEIELGDLRQVVAELREAEDGVDDGLRVGRGLAAVAGDELRGLAGEHELASVLVGERGDPDARVADQLGEDAARPERDERPEERILDDAREELR